MRHPCHNIALHADFVSMRGLEQEGKDHFCTGVRRGVQILCRPGEGYVGKFGPLPLEKLW